MPNWTLLGAWQKDKDKEIVEEIDQSETGNKEETPPGNKAKNNFW
jgi:hypothetical protein